MAAINPSRMIVRVSEGQYGDSEFLWTGDGGATWNSNYLPNRAGGDDVFASGGDYWSIGGEVVGKDKPGGGRRIPMAVRSAGGVTWEHLPVFYEACHSTGCGGCTAQGCFAGRSSFVPFSRILAADSNQSGATLEHLMTFPGHVLSHQWIRAGNTLCVLTNRAIQCATMKPVEKLDTQDDEADWVDESFPALRSSRPSMLGSTSIEPALTQGIHCVRCDLVNVYTSQKAKTGPAEIILRFTIGPDGGVDTMDVSGGIPPDVADKVRSAAQGWLFEPYLQDGKPTGIKVAIRGRVMIMNPDSRWIQGAAGQQLRQPSNAPPPECRVYRDAGFKKCCLLSGHYDGLGGTTTSDNRKGRGPQPCPFAILSKDNMASAGQSKAPMNFLHPTETTYREML